MQASEITNPGGGSFFAVNVGAIARNAEVGFLRGEIIDDTEHGIGSAHQAERHAGAGLISQIIISTIEGVDDPVEFIAGKEAGIATELFANDGQASRF